MTALPPALRPWAQALELLDGTVQTGFSTWLAPLRSLFGPMASPRRDTDGDPDGYDGITRRGTYDRLLLSEWAVALEVPEEFLRRAAMHEHVFTRPAFVSPQANSRCVALLDVGPRQLGAPRLAHLAALVVLETRALAEGSTFSFGTLQHPEAKLRQLEHRSLQNWTERISWTDAPTDPEPNRTRLEENDVTECWLIGASSLRPLAADLEANLLVVEESLPGDERALQLTAHPRGRSAASVLLRLPPNDVCTRTLRNPMARVVRVHSTRSAVPDTLGMLDAKGRRLILRDQDGGIAAHHVPNTSNEPPGRPKRVLPDDEDETVLGADICGRIIALCRGRDGQLTLRGSGLKGGRSLGEYFVLDVDVPPSLQTASSVHLMVCEAEDSSFAAWILDNEGQLWRLTVRVRSDNDPQGHQSLSCVERGCRDFVRVNRDHFAWRSLSQNRFLASDSSLELSDIDAEQAVFSSGPDTDSMSVAWVDGNEVRVRPTPPGTTPMVAPDGEVFGLFRHGRSGPPTVLFMQDQRHILQRSGAASDRKLFTARASIKEIRFEPCSSRIVWLTEAGGIGVFCLERDQVVLRLDLTPSEDTP